MIATLTWSVVWRLVSPLSLFSIKLLRNIYSTVRPFLYRYFHSLVFLDASKFGDCVLARGLASTTVAPPTDVSRAADDVVPSAVPSSGGVVPSNDVDISPHGGEVVSPDKEQSPPPVQDGIASSEQGKSVTEVQKDPAATDPVENPSRADTPIPVGLHKVLSPSFSRFLTGASKKRCGKDTSSSEFS